MEQATQETTAQTTEQAAPATEKPKKKSNAFVYAVLQNVTTGEHNIISEKQKKDLSKRLGSMPDWKLIGSFKGKQLSVSEKKSFNFN